MGGLPNKGILNILLRQTASGALRRVTRNYSAKTVADLAARGKLIAFKEDGVKQVSYVGAYGMKFMAQAAVEGLDRKTMILFKGFAEAVGHNVARRQGMLELHQYVGAGAQLETVKAYQRLVLDVQRIPSYRVGEDRLPGKLLQALQDPSFITIQRDGVLFGNTAMLDSVAAHWYRLNFGAGQRANETATVAYQGNTALVGAAPTTTGIKFMRQLIDQYTLAHPPSKPFSMPWGVFISPGGGLQDFDSARRGRDPFFPMYILRNQLGSAIDKGTLTGAEAADYYGMLKRFGGSKGEMKPTQGIAARRFLDAGMSYLIQNLYAGYTKLATEWVKEALVEKGPYARYMDVDPDTASELIAHIASLQNQVRRTGH